ncbi:MAG: L,D-transpeptidase family protein [Acidobacteria bacterium]|nr:L,D-transpeptidase family protein [Acidobacteriota bacterium]
MKLRGLTAFLTGSMLLLTAADTPSVSRSEAKPFLPPAPSPQEGGLISGLVETIQQGDLDQALESLSDVVHGQPNFRLAQLVYADLLMARSGQLSGFGNGGPGELVDGLRQEAQMRLRRYLVTPPEQALPANLLQLPEGVSTALLFDVQAYRMYLLRRQGDGLARGKDYYISIGKGGTDKQSEGDDKTPIGVYHVASYLPGTQLPDLYGVGAFPTTYPNPWDRRLGRTGSGIWIHGTEFETYSRPPLSSRGCLTLSNQDFLALMQDVEIGRTPVIVSRGVDWRDPSSLARERETVRTALDQWRKDWESLDTDRYLSHYSRDFRSEEGSRQAFAAHKRRVNETKQFVRVALREVGIYRYPGEEGLLLVEFLQDYRSSNLSSQRRKHQYWREEAGGLKIVFEAGS